jgi:tRNA modification GTPase
LKARLDQLLRQITELSSRLESRGSSSRSIEVALAGLPNAGKSSLFNALLGKNRTIVSSESGTTRDSVSAAVSIQGLDSASVTLVDTAGVECADAASARGIAQELLPRRLETCDVVVWCVDRSDPIGALEIPQNLQNRIGRKGLWISVGTKADLCSSSADTEEFSTAVSVHWPESIAALRNLLRSAIQSVTDQRFTEATHQTAVRCRAALDRAEGSFSMALQMLSDSAGHELVANELRCALDDLSSIIGEVHSEDILGQIFSRFCIGK